MQVLIVHFYHARMYILDILKCTLLQSKSEVLKKRINNINELYILPDESNKKIEFLVAIFKEAFRGIK